MLSINGRKLRCDSKNWCKAETVKKCLINRIRLIDYNWMRSRISLMDVSELMHNKEEIDVQV